MLAPFVLAIVAAHAPCVAQGNAALQAPVSPVQVPGETAWPPVGVFRQGPGITSPRLIRDTKPSYTPDAMRAGVQGSVQMEAVVQADGTVGEVRVVRSLDQKFGLDEQSVKSLKQWRFEPGKKDGIAVPVLIDVEMAFALGLPKRKWPRFLRSSRWVTSERGAGV